MTPSTSDTTEPVQGTGKREEWHVKGEELVATMQQLFHEGNIRRIIIKHEGQTVMEIPVTVGVVTTLVAPWLAAAGAIGALLTQCTVEVVRSDHPTERPRKPLVASEV